MLSTVYQRKNIDNTVIDINSDTQPEMTSNCSFAHYIRAGLAITSVVGMVALVQKTGFLSSSWRSSDVASDNSLDNPYPLISSQDVIIFTDNNLPIQPRHAKRAFGSEFQINTYTTSDQKYPSAAGLSTGDFVVVWESDGQDGNYTGIYGQRYSSTGVPQGNEFQINTYTTSDQWYPSVAGLSTGDFVVAWESLRQGGNYTGIYGQRYSSTGVPQGNEFQINTYTLLNQKYPSAAGLSTGDFVVTWASDGQDGDLYGIYGQRYSSTGVPQGNEFQINTYTTNSQEYPSVATLTTGDFVVTWASGEQDDDWYGIYGQRYSSTGAAQGSEFQVNTYTLLSQRYPSVAGLSTGDFVVAWASDVQDGSDYGIYGQRFSNTGVPQGSEFQVSTYTTLNQKYPSVAALSSGNFVVMWRSFEQDGDDYGIYGQHYSSNGIPLGSEFQVNTYTTRGQNNPSVAGLSTGNFVVTWYSSGQDGDGYGIYGRIYYNETPVLGGNTLTLNEGETILLSSANLNATDSDNDDANLIFTVSNIQYGQFERASNAGIAITNFTQQEVIDGGIQFAHDGSTNQPIYNVSVSDGALSSVASSPSITFTFVNDAPILGNNVLIVNEGETVILDTANLSATDSDHSDADLTFTLSNIQYGQFERVSNPGIVITNFTQQEIIDGAIQFVHDGSENLPSYDVTVSDGLLVDATATANIFFTYVNDAPLLINNPFILEKGETITITPSLLNAIDSDNNSLELIFNITNNYNGYFRTTANDITITQFTLQQIIDYEIMFVSDGTNFPEYTLYVTDGNLASASEISSIVYITQNQLVTKPGDAIVLSQKELAMQSQILSTMLEISLSNIQYGRFEKNIDPGVAIFSFTLSELNARAIRFIHSGTEHVPQFTLHFKDISANYTFSRGAVSNTILNHPPIVSNPIGTLNWQFNKETSYPISNTLFSDPDGQLLQLSVKEFNGNALPQWIQFDNSTNILKGIPATSGLYDFKIIARDLYDEIAEDRFYVDVKMTNTTTIIGESANPVPIVAAIAGGATLLGGCLAAGIFYNKKARDRKTRQQHEFARKVRHHLGLQKVDNFDSERGKRFVQAVVELSGLLQEEQGIDITNVDENRLDELARNIATAAKNKISPATAGLWKKSAITIQEFADNIDEIAQDNRLENISYVKASDDVSIPMHTL